MSSRKRTHTENKSAELASLLLRPRTEFARDFQAILLAFSRATVDGDCQYFAAKAAGMAHRFEWCELSGPRTVGSRGRPWQPAGYFYFLNFFL